MGGDNTDISFTMTWVNIKKWKLMKAPGKLRAAQKFEPALQTTLHQNSWNFTCFIGFVFSQTNLVIKFNPVHIGTMDSFHHIFFLMRLNVLFSWGFKPQNILVILFHVSSQVYSRLHWRKASYRHAMKQPALRKQRSEIMY